MATNVEIPSLGESISEATLNRWLKPDGAEVAVDDPLCELETDKAAVEIPSPAAGILKHLKQQGDTVRIGETVASIGEGGGKSAPAKAEPQKSEEKEAPEKAPPKKEAPKQAEAEKPREQKQPPPLVSKPAANREVAAAAPRPDEPGTRREPMSKIRKKIAERLLGAQKNAAILTTFNEVDLTEVLGLRARYKEQFEKQHGTTLGLMSFFVRASVLALQEFPVVNAFVEGDDIVYHDYVHMGIAVSTDRGLVVPVLRNSERMSFSQIESEIKRMGQAAKQGKLGLQELSGGTFTITNGGVFGSLFSTPILNPPQSAILGMHATLKRPRALPDGKIEVRPMMYLALSYDHRLIDGKDSVQFLVRIKGLLEDPVRLTLGL